MGDSPAGAELVAVYVTVPDRGAARAVAEALLGAGETRLAACVNIIPGVESMYWWDGAVQTDSELLLMIKTRRELLPALTREVVRVHPYETPEVSLGGGGGGISSFFWGGVRAEPAPPPLHPAGHRRAHRGRQRPLPQVGQGQHGGRGAMTSRGGSQRPTPGWCCDHPG